MKKTNWLLASCITCLFLRVTLKPAASADDASPFTKATYNIRADARASDGGRQTPWATVYIYKDGSVEDALNSLKGTFDFDSHHILWGGTKTAKVGNTKVTTTYEWDGELRQAGPGKFEGDGTYKYSGSSGLTAEGPWKVMSVMLHP